MMTNGSEEMRVSQVGERGFEAGKVITGPQMTEAEPLNAEYAEWAEFSDRGLRMQGFPVALKLCEREEDIPKEAKRPVRE